MDPDTAEVGQAMAWLWEGAVKHTTAPSPCWKELQAKKALACLARPHTSEGYYKDLIPSLPGTSAGTSPPEFPSGVQVTCPPAPQVTLKPVFACAPPTHSAPRCMSALMHMSTVNTLDPSHTREGVRCSSHPRCNQGQQPQPLAPPSRTRMDQKQTEDRSPPVGAGKDLKPLLTLN